MADQSPEDATSQDYFAHGAPGYVEAQRTVAPPRYEAAGHPADEVGRVARALERLSDRIETAESRQALAIAGVERSVREVIGRIDAAEREQMQVAARFESVAQEVQGEQGKLAERIRRMELEAQGPRSAEALRALEGSLGKIAGHVYDAESRTREAMAEIGSRIDRIANGEQLTASAIRELQSSCSALDERLGVAELGAAEGMERLAVELSAQVEATRQELTERLSVTADARFDRVEQALAQMSEHVRAAEERSAGALERMGREVLEVAQTLSRRVQGVEHRSAEATERFGAEMSRIADAVEGRLAHADSIQAQALERLGGEIARITERLADRIASAERRSAQAIDDVGEQVARVTERIGQRHDRSASDLADRIRLSEERTARLLEDARQKIDARLAEVHARSAPAAASDGDFEDADDSLFADAPFPAHEAPTPAERPFVRPQALSVFSPTVRAPRAEPLSFEEEDFEAVAGIDAPTPAEPVLAAAEDRDARSAAEAPRFDDHMLAELELAQAPLEPNVGFDLDEPPAIAASAEPEELADRDPESDESEQFHDAWTSIASSEAEAEPTTAAEESPAPLTTREIIERARSAARAARERDQTSPEPAARAGGEGVLESLSFGHSRRRNGGMTSALLVAGMLAAVSLAAGGYAMYQESPSAGLPKSVDDALAMIRGDRPAPTAPAQSPEPMAAVAFAPKPTASAAPAAAGPGPEAAAEYAAAVARVTAGDAKGLDDVRRLADQGYAPAEFFLSKLYEDGRSGLKKDPVQARGWTEKAADAGDRAAMHNLALDYFEGVGGARDPSAAAEWFRRAADLGLLDSQFNLAGLYEHGQGVSQNPAEAYKWYLIAARAGDAEAKASALRVRAQLTPEARAVAERAAEAFAPSAPAQPAPTAQAAAASGSPDVVTAQRALNQLGYYQGPTDGVGSPALHLAIAAYQRDQSLPVTGAADAATIGKLAVYTR